MTVQTQNAIGHVCAILQRPYTRIKAAAEALGLQPVVIVNGVAHYSDGQVEQIGEHLREQTN